MPDIRRIPNKIIESKHICITNNFVGGRTSIHMHDFFEIELVLEGKGKHLLNGVIYDIAPGSLYMLSPFDFHSVFDVEEKIKLININFDSHFLSLFSLQKLVNKKNNYIFNLNTEDRKEAEKIIELLSKRCSSSDKYSEKSIENMLECLLLFILSQSEKETSSETDIDLPPIQASMKYIFSHYKENISLADVAKLCGFSESYFCRQFKLTTGKTYVEFINLLRLNYAKILLLSDKKSILEISQECGFTSVSNFNKVFRNQMKMSPTEFAKNKP